MFVLNVVHECEMPQTKIHEFHSLLARYRFKYMFEIVLSGDTNNLIYHNFYSVDVLVHFFDVFFHLICDWTKWRCLPVSCHQKEGDI